VGGASRHEKLTPSYSAPEVSAAIDLAVEEAEGLHGTLERIPFLVTDNGSRFLARHFQKTIKDRFRHVRTRCRTSQQLGLLERFHQTLKREEVYWQLYDHPQDAREKLEAFQRRYRSSGRTGPSNRRKEAMSSRQRTSTPRAEPSPCRAGRGGPRRQEKSWTRRWRRMQS
jgi:transposase InsO family protein